jgi:formylglycine-generating enzyme required for sulfatase activity
MAEFAQGHALLIGVGTYYFASWLDVPVTVTEADRVRAVLADPELAGYPPQQIALLHDQHASRNGILQALDKLAAVTQPDDTVLIYYAGHGAPGTDGNYHLTACDTRFTSKRVNAGSGIAEGELLEKLRAIPAQRLIFFCNACYAGRMSPHLGVGEGDNFSGQPLPGATAAAILGSGAGRIIVSACREEQQAWIGNGELSLFAQALVDGLSGQGWVGNNAGYIGAFGLYEYLYETVKEAAGALSQAQEPELTVLKGVGPFPLALYRGAQEHANFDAEALPQETAVREVSEKDIQRYLKRWGGKRTINTGGGAYIEGNVNISGGDFVGRDKNVFNGDTTQINNPKTVIIQPINPEKAAAARHEAARRAYLRELRAACQTLPLAAVGEDASANADLTLDQVYIDLDTTATVKQEQVKSSSRRATVANSDSEEERRVTAIEATTNPRLALLGDPGAGKSTFVRHLAAWLAGSALGEVTPPPGFTNDLTPILVTLRDLAPRLGALQLDNRPEAVRQAALLDALREQIRVEVGQFGKEAVSFAGDLLQQLNDGHCLLVLDGLDEVPSDLRERVREAAAAAIRRCKVERIIVTCRIRSYHGPAVFSDFSAYTLAPFDEEKIKQFARGWYNTQVKLKKFAEADAEKRAADFAHAATALRELAANPMLLTSMAIIHQRDIGLPDQRVKLYSLVVDVLVRRWQRHKAGEVLPSVDLVRFLKDDLRLRTTLERLGYEAQRASNSPYPDTQSGDLLRMKALEILERQDYLGNITLAHEFLDYVDQRAGLLVGRGGEPGKPLAYGFPHRSLQEYLAGCYLIGQRDLMRSFYAHAGEGEVWDLAAQLGMEELYYNRRSLNTLLDLAYQLCASCTADTPRNQRALLWSGQVAALVGVPPIRQDSGRPDGGQVYLERIRAQLVTVLSGSLPPVERCEAGNALARLGDPRPDVLTLEGMCFCFVPGGAFEVEKGQKTEIPPFWLGQHPVSQAQFAVFVQEGGYTDPQWWQEAIKDQWWGKAGFKGRYDNQPRQAPNLCGMPFDLPNHPVVGVSWYEALAFTRWLEARAHRMGWLPANWGVGLPNEQEWEKAARGGEQLPQPTLVRVLSEGLPPDGPRAQCPNLLPRREYPWGDGFDIQKANIDETGIGSTSALGCFAGGVGPYGNLDLSGNVWEWQENWWGEERESKALRGGSWFYDQLFAGCSDRYGDDPGNWYYFVGLRCALSPRS